MIVKHGQDTENPLGRVGIGNFLRQLRGDFVDFLGLFCEEGCLLRIAFPRLRGEEQLLYGKAALHRISGDPRALGLKKPCAGALFFLSDQFGQLFNLGVLP